jgi:hypothetical protein
VSVTSDTSARLKRLRTAVRSRERPIIGVRGNGRSWIRGDEAVLTMGIPAALFA